MSRLCVAPIVEGHGEFQSIRPLLTRIWLEIVGGEFIDVLQPIRQPRSQLVLQPGVEKALALAESKLGQSRNTDRKMVLLLLDSDEDCPKELAPKLLNFAQNSYAHLDFSCVLANVEFETWFIGAADSLREYLKFNVTPENAEENRLGKGWVERHFVGSKYSETVDQPSMTCSMDLSKCRAQCPSFDKICRELEKRRS